MKKKLCCVVNPRVYSGSYLLCYNCYFQMYPTQAAWGYPILFIKWIRTAPIQEIRSAEISRKRFHLAKLLCIIGIHSLVSIDCQCSEDSCFLSNKICKFCYKILRTDCTKCTVDNCGERALLVYLIETIFKCRLPK